VKGWPNLIVWTYLNFPDKSNGIPQQAEVALGFPGRLRPRIISTFGTTRVVGRQPYAPAAFTPAEIPGTESTSGHMVLSGTTEKSPVTPPGIDPGTVRLVAQRLNHYITPGPNFPDSLSHSPGPIV
jgi:hypothetical protein